MMVEAVQSTEFGPWNPGLSSAIPQRFQSLSTLYQPENTSTELTQAKELSDFTGLPEKDLVRFRPERLLVHETLIRVMANLSVPDGSHYGDLGINFRSITDTILSKYAAPELPKIVQAFEEMSANVEALLSRELEETVFRPLSEAPKPKEEPASFLER